jgi:hypothetical protein
MVVSMKMIVVSGDWAVGTDAVQWILYRAQKGDSPWRSLSFVTSTRDILERCMREKGCPEMHRAVLLAALPPHYVPAK